MYDSVSKVVYFDIQTSKLSKNTSDLAVLRAREVFYAVYQWRGKRMDDKSPHARRELRTAVGRTALRSCGVAPKSMLDR